MQTFRTKTHELAFTEVPKEVKEISLVYWPDSDTGYTMIYYDRVQQQHYPGNWQLLRDDCTKVTEEMAKIICEEYKGLYRMYEHAEDYFWIKGALNSFGSIFESLGLTVRNKFGTKPEIKIRENHNGEMELDHINYAEKLFKWQSEEEKVKRYAVLYRPI